MGGQILDFLAALLFMSGLVLVSRIRQHMKAEDETGYRYITGGLSLLAVVSLLRIYGGLDLFEGVPFLADRLFFRMIVWIAAASGLILLLSGISTWLPLSRALRMFNKERWQRVELVRKVAQLVKVESRPPVILAKTLDYITADFGFAHGALYLYSQKERRMHLSSTSGHATVAHSLLETTPFEMPQSVHGNADELSVSRLAVGTLPAGLTNPSVVQPVFCGQKIAAVFFLWNDANQPVEDDLRTNLKIMAGIIGMRIQLDTASLRQEYNEKLSECQEKLSEIPYLQSPLTENLVRIKKLLKGVMPVDLLSMTVNTEDGKAQRYSVGENGTVLKEIGANASLPAGCGTTAGGALKPMVINDITSEPESVIDDFVCGSRMGSMAAIPLAAGETLEGVCTIASRDTNCYNTTEVSALSVLAPLLTSILSEEKHRRSRAASLRRIKLVREFNDLSGCTKNRDDLLDRASVILSDEIKPSIVRFSTFDSDGAFLTSQRMTMRRPTANVTPSGGHMILSLMPLHRQLKENGKVIVVNHFQDLNPMSAIETAQAFLPDCKGAIMVPVKKKGAVTGVIGMARKEDSRQEVFTPEDIELATTIAGVLSDHSEEYARIGIDTNRITSGMLTVQSLDPDNDLKSRLKSSLTGIIGSLELIKSSRQRDKKTERYLDIIEKSARRMSSYCEEEAPV